MPTLQPAFSNPVHDAQRTFRSILDAMAHPGTIRAVAPVSAPAPLVPAIAALCLTLLDLETHVWVQPGLPEACQTWLQFHTGFRRTETPHLAQFALVWDMQTAPPLETFCLGSSEFPEASTTLIGQLPALEGGRRVEVQGPGILGTRAIAPPLPAPFWPQWQINHQHYPLGVDVILCAETDLLALPRTAQVQLSTDAL